MILETQVLPNFLKLFKRLQLLNIETAWPTQSQRQLSEGENSSRLEENFVGGSRPRFADGCERKRV